MFEYQILRADGFVSVDELNSLGNNGWELVFMATDDDGYDYIFKRFRRPNQPAQQQQQLQVFNKDSKLPPDKNTIIRTFADVD